MKASYKTDAFRSFRRILPLVAVALALAGPPRAWGQCVQGIKSVVLYQNSVIAGVTSASGLVTLNCNSWYVPTVIDFYSSPDNLVQCSSAIVGEGGTEAGFWCGAQTGASGVYTLRTGVESPPMGGPRPTVSLTVFSNGSPENGSNIGVCPAHACNAGAPINIVDGNVWIDERDYSVPGLGGGLNLTRVWNSRWAYASPPVLAGMFGYFWRSTYEEMISGEKRVRSPFGHPLRGQ